jgi:hypothetical protein
MSRPSHRRPLIRRLVALLAVLAAPGSLAAQGLAEVVRGRITDDSSRAVAGALVYVTRGPDRLVRQDTADTDGRYSVRFDTGTGDYLVAVSAAGLRSVRRRVQRQGNERELVADFVLARDLSVLAAVQVTATRPVRASNTVSPTQGETGAAEKWSDGVAGQLPPTMAGDLNGIAGTMPGVTLGPGGPSILGGGPESNLQTLNGMGLAAGSIPRAARTETRVTGASFDPTRGGFAGANIDVRLGPGDRFYQRRNGFLTLDAPQLQFTDPVGRALGARSGGFRGSLGADGELIRGALTYNVAVDAARSASSPATLVDADAETLLRAGIDPDSVNRLYAAAASLGLPLSGSGVPGTRRRDALTWLGRLDDTRDTLQTRAFTTYVGTVREGALGFGPLAAPSTGGERREDTYGTQLTHGIFLGPGRRVLTESRLAASAVTTEVSPYQMLPGASVLVRSATLDDRRDVTGLTVGGSPSLASDERRWTLEGANETAWNARGSRHRFKALVWGRGDGLRQEATANAFGNYTYNSLEDLAANRPASFTRTLTQPVRSGTAWNTAAALAHRYVPSRFFSVLYGARVEGSGFGSAPPRNVALEEALGVETGVAPTTIHVSPRAGFTFQYNRDRDNGSGTNMGPVGKFYRGTTGVVRGGIGEFRDLLRPGLLAEAAAGAGLPGSTEVLSCVGDAVPVPDWEGFLANPSSIPTACAGGGGVLGERAPSVTLIDPSYDVPRSWRASLDWNTNFGKMNLRVSGLASYDLSQPGTVDANFAGAQQFALAEDGRPVYVSTAAIDPASGAVSAAESRRASAFGRVGVRTSDLRGYGGQLTVGIAPDVFKFRGPGGLFASANYTLQRTRRQFRGFDGAGFGDPRLKEWAPGPTDARHGIVLSGGFRTSALGTITLFSRLQSGLPFTPIVQGDLNGDGRFGDRAFIPALRSSDVVSEFDNQLAALMRDGSKPARDCIARYSGEVAARNGCRGPWTQSLNVQWSPRLPGALSRYARRVTPTVYFQNPLGGLDQLLHGADGLRGWGTTMTPDATLLVPRGFDAGSRRFTYDVNPKFGDTRGARSLVREPFRVTIDFSLNLSTDYSLQQLRRALEPVRTREGWSRRTADSLAAFYLSRTSSIHTALLAESDSLFLSTVQVSQLRQADSAYGARVRALYVPLGEYLARIPDGVANKAALDTVAATEKLYWQAFWEQPEIADAAITPTQRELFPMLKGMLAVEKKDRERSQWQFGSPVRLYPSLPASASPPPPARRPAP